MMAIKQTLIYFIASFVLATFANADDINEDYKEILHGETKFSVEHIAPIWSQFKSEFGQKSPVSLEASDAMTNFFKNIEEIIKHNSK